MTAAKKGEPLGVVYLAVGCVSMVLPLPDAMKLVTLLAKAVVVDENFSAPIFKRAYTLRSEPLRVEMKTVLASDIQAPVDASPARRTPRSAPRLLPGTAEDRQ